MTQSNDLKKVQEFSIEELFNKSGNYIIPIYQRNYAWGKTEIQQLLQDLVDAQKHSKDSNYYLGSLVVHKRKDGKFEIIDGQQRHTTLCILLAVLNDNDQVKNLTINLDFEHRSKSGSSLQKLFSRKIEDNKADDIEPTMRDAYGIMKNFLKEKEDITTYLLKNTKILRVVVPEDTDLNHYFEIMNSRGEQLEKHEVLKARLMKPLNSNECTAFATIWDACADMSRYVVMGFKSDDRNKIFGNEWKECLCDFEGITGSLISNNIKKDNKPQSLNSILQNPKFKRKTESKEEDGKYGSVINFPNFLLQVLSVMKNQNIPLDDKRLLESFDEFKDKNQNKFTDDFSKEFIITLLKIRFLFDKWIIKSENEKWGLQRIKPTGKGDYSMVNTIEDNDKNKLNTQLEMIQAMFHVSFTNQTNKHWLTAALKFLCDSTPSTNSDYINSDSIHAAKYICFLECLSDKFFYGRFGFEKPIEYESIVFKSFDWLMYNQINIDFLHKDTDVKHFIFNRLDYLLWKEIVVNKGVKQTITYGKDVNNVQERAKEFRFTTSRNSVEHFYPQRWNEEEPLNIDKGCDCFGNLCLISNSSNSRLSDRLPVEKAKYESESLKQAIMMSHASSWNPKGVATISKHQTEMITILFSTTECSCNIAIK